MHTWRRVTVIIIIIVTTIMTVIIVVFTISFLRQKSDAPTRISTSSRRRVAPGRSRQWCHKLLRAQ